MTEATEERGMPSRYAGVKAIMKGVIALMTLAVPVLLILAALVAADQLPTVLLPWWAFVQSAFTSVLTGGAAGVGLAILEAAEKYLDGE